MDKPHNAQQDGEHEFGDQDDAVGRLRQVRNIHPDERIDQARHGQHDDGHECDGGISLDREGEVRAQAPAMRDERHEAAHPQHHKYQVPQQRVRAVIVIATGRRVAFKADGDYLQDGQQKQHRLHGPGAAEAANNSHGKGDEHRNAPHDGGGNFRKGHFQNGQVEDLKKRRAGQVRHDHRDFYQPHGRSTEGRPRASAGGDMAVDR